MYSTRCYSECWKWLPQTCDRGHLSHIKYFMYGTFLFQHSAAPFWRKCRRTLCSPCIMLPNVPKLLIVPDLRALIWEWGRSGRDNIQAFLSRDEINHKSLRTATPKHEQVWNQRPSTATFHNPIITGLRIAYDVTAVNVVFLCNVTAKSCKIIESDTLTEQT